MLIFCWVFFWSLADRNGPFGPLKQMETLVIFGGCFSGRLPIGMAHFKTPEGGKLLSIFCWLLADRNSLILNP